MAEVDFGTRAESKVIRKFAKDALTKLVRPLYPSDAALRIPDAVPLGEQRVILATGSYIGEGFDDARLGLGY
jgi:hypothetical protein